MNVFTSGHRNQPWIWQVTGLCFVLGVLLAGSLQTVQYISRAGLALERTGQSGGVAPTVRLDLLKDRENTIKALQKQNTELENTLGSSDSQAKKLNEELQKMKILGAYTEVHGPGIALTLQDSKKRGSSARSFEAVSGIIHDSDLQMVLNELGQSGAEAMAINSQRINGRTSLRCVGPTVMVNNVPLVPPYMVQAIGDPDTLWGGLNLPSGVLDGIRRFDPEMVKVEKKKDMILPPYTGSTDVKYAKPTSPKEKEGEKGSRASR